MSINAIVAMDGNRGIGWENKLPWPHNKKDMQWFRDQTSGHVVVMGRKTWESLGNKKLPNRINVVLTNNPWSIEGSPDHIISGEVESILDLLAEEYPDLHIWVIGGADIYLQALPHCDKLYVTMMKKAYRCDAFLYDRHLEDFNQCNHIDDDEDMTIQIRSRNAAIS